MTGMSDKGRSDLPKQVHDLRARLKEQERAMAGQVRSLEMLKKDLAETRHQVEVKEEAFRFLAEHGGGLVFQADAEGLVLYLSPACVTMIGKDPQEFNGRPIAFLLALEDREPF